MRVGIFADSHDHLDHVRRVVDVFNENACELVIFAGDFVSPLVIPPLRNLRCPMIACFGDNDGNKLGIQGGMRIVGLLAEAPFGYVAQDGTKFLVTHILDHVSQCIDGADVIVYAHTHRPSEARDSSGRLYINPGETGGWFFRQPSVTLLETDTMETRRIEIDPEMSLYPPKGARPATDQKFAAPLPETKNL
ncbi:MAG TPA: YfcE family phosphodiesterase [Planctomycetaceae bacterium]|nr:YfcE family phosphodiesterase [Planctomycetaceae bacterium]